MKKILSAILLRWPISALWTWALAWLLYVALVDVWGLWAALGAAVVAGAALAALADAWWRRWMIALGFPLSWLLAAGGDVPPWAWLVPLAALLVLYPVGTWRDAPLFPTPAGALDALAAHIALPDGARVLDAGCGAGDGLRALRRAWPAARLEGLEWSWPLVALSALRCPWARVRRGDIWAADWGDYALVYIFQRPESMGRAAIKCLTEMRDGAWLVSLNFPIEHAPPTHTVDLPDGRQLYAWRAPIAAIDREQVQAHEEAAEWARHLPLRTRAQRRWR